MSTKIPPDGSDEIYYGQLSHSTSTSDEPSDRTIVGVDKLKDEVMNRLYSPSRWTKRMSPDDVVDAHIELVTSVSDRAKTRLNCQLDVRYGFTDRQAYDILYDNSKSATGKPIVVYIHGGYWQALSKDISSYMAEPVVNAGAVCVAVGYDLCPTVSMTEIVEQIRQAIRHIEQWATANQSSGIYLVGHSAGAQLVTMILASTYCQSLIKGAVLISGVYDLRPLLQTNENLVLKMTHAEAWTLSPMNPDIVSAVFRRRPNVKIIIAVAEDDSPPFREQSQQFYQLLSDRNSSSTLLIDVPDVDHFNIVENLHDSDFTLTRIVIELVSGSPGL